MVVALLWQGRGWRAFGRGKSRRCACACPLSALEVRKPAFPATGQPKGKGCRIGRIPMIGALAAAAA